MNKKENKTMFHPGDVARVKKLANAPEMIVSKVVFSNFKVNGGKASQNDLEYSSQKVLQGVECYWFTNDGTHQIKTFNTKDLEICESYDS